MINFGGNWAHFILPFGHTAVSPYDDEEKRSFLTYKQRCFVILKSVVAFLL